MQGGYENPALSCAQYRILAYAAIHTVNVSQWSMLGRLFGGLLFIVYMFVTKVVVGG
jgi:hypothetical protein